MTGYARKFDENATMSFKINDKQLLKNYNKIWEKVEKLMKIESESKPVYSDNDKYIKIKIKIYAGNIITNIHNIKMPKEKATCKYVIVLKKETISGVFVRLINVYIANF